MPIHKFYMDGETGASLASSTDLSYTQNSRHRLHTETGVEASGPLAMPTAFYRVSPTGTRAGQPLY